MQITILFFGQLTDITGQQSIQLEDIPDTDTLSLLLHQQFPALANSKYAIAIDKKLINSNKMLLYSILAKITALGLAKE